MGIDLAAQMAAVMTPHRTARTGRGISPRSLARARPPVHEEKDKSVRKQRTDR
jgi:hypothetical protein